MIRALGDDALPSWIASIPLRRCVDCKRLVEDEGIAVCEQGDTRAAPRVPVRTVRGAMNAKTYTLTTPRPAWER